ncbi:MAG: hypothetical protein M3R69_11280 [Acidobacteriota bacterium]|nr:hypothetical protein [Acidobacteriota bacterium]
MKTVTKEQSARRFGYKVILTLVIGAAALSNAGNDLNHPQGLADNVWHLGSKLLSVGVNTVNANSSSAGGSSNKNVTSADQSGWNAQIRREAIEIDGDIGVNLPSTFSTEFKDNAFNRGTPSDFPGSMSRIIKQRRLSGTSANGRRELVLKTESMSLRPVG